MKTKTFWLARDVDYNLSSNPMMFEKGSFFPTEKAKVFEYFSTETAKILGLPILRKGQQVQIKRTNNGFEIVKGKEK